MDEIDIICCRICLSKHNLCNIFDNKIDMKISEKVMYCASVQISDRDLLPQLICKNCISSAHTAHRFKTVCEDTDSKLREIIKNEVIDMQVCINMVDKIIENSIVNDDEANNNDFLKERGCNNNNVLNMCKTLPNNNHKQDDLNVINVYAQNVIELHKSEAIQSNQMSEYYEESQELTDFIQEVEIDCTSIEDEIIPLSPNFVHQFESADVDNKDDINKSPIGRHIAMKKAGQHPRKLSQINAEKAKFEDNTNYNKSENIDSDSVEISNRIERKTKRRKINKEHINLNNSEDIKTDPKMSAAESIPTNSFLCKVCEKSFPFRSHLIRHLNKHTGIKQFNCKHCKKTFINKYNLSVHLKTHSGDYSLNCKVCLKGFSSQSILKRHMTSHSGELPFQCKFCNKRFVQAGSLKLHEHMHVNNPSFSCQLCFKTFSYTNSLAAHMRTHSGVKAHTCKICIRSFTRNTSLQRHVLSCHQFKCDLCNLNFNANADYLIHLKTHATT